MNNKTPQIHPVQLQAARSFMSLLPIIQKFLTITSIAFIFTGCQTSGQAGSQASSKSDKEEVFRQIGKRYVEITDLTKLKQGQEVKVERLQQELNAYALDHTLATSSILVLNDELAKLIKDSLQDDKLLRSFTIGATSGAARAYCEYNEAECEEVTAKLTELQKRLRREEAALQSIGDQIERKQIELDSLKTQAKQ